MLRHLVERLPVMVTPRWIDTRTPAGRDRRRRRHARRAGRRATTRPAEVQLGGADVLTYREMMRRFAARRRAAASRCVVTVPLLTPRLSSYWVALVTPVELGLVRPLVEGLSAETVVREPPPPGLNDAPLGLRRRRARGARG